MNRKKVVVHTDIIFDHLLQPDQSASLLHLAMRQCMCYTTVVNAVELFSFAGSARQRRMIEDSLAAMKILGMNSRTAKNIGLLKRQYPGCAFGDILVAGICLESRLPLLTTQQEIFRGIKRLNLMSPASLQ